MSLLLLAGGVMWVLQGTGRLDRDRIQDGAFVAQANTVCAGVADTVYADTRHHSDSVDDADRLRRLDEGWSRMLDDLDAVHVSPAAEPKVDQWLAQWREVVRLLGVYATEVDQTGRPTPATSRAINRAKQTVDRFAYVNGINSCLFL